MPSDCRVALGHGYKIMMGFHEMAMNVPGKRLMDIDVNGRKVEADLDIRRLVGWGADFFKTEFFNAGGQLLCCRGVPCGRF